MSGTRVSGTRTSGVVSRTRPTQERPYTPRLNLSRPSMVGHVSLGRESLWLSLFFFPETLPVLRGPAGTSVRARCQDGPSSTERSRTPQTRTLRVTRLGSPGSRHDTTEVHPRVTVRGLLGRVSENGRGPLPPRLEHTGSGVHDL